MEGTPLGRVRQRYDSAAGLYDSIEKIPLLGNLENTYRLEALRMLHPARGETILDLGCGTGTMLALASELYPSCPLIGVDISPRMLELTAQKILGVRTELADAADLPFPSGSIDNVISSYALSIIPDLEGTLEEIRRVMKPHGRLLVLDSTRPDGIARVTYPITRLVARTVGFTRLDREIPDLLLARFVPLALRKHIGGYVFCFLGKPR